MFAEEDFVDRNIIFFSAFRGQPAPDGVVCVERKKYIDKTEKDQLKECFVQNVTQCYYTYITEYSEAEQEKCEDFYWKMCKIVFKERVFNATARNCKRPLIKKCDENTGYNKCGTCSQKNVSWIPVPPLLFWNTYSGKGIIGCYFNGHAKPRKSLHKGLFTGPRCIFCYIFCRFLPRAIYNLPSYIFVLCAPPTRSFQHIYAGAVLG